MALERSPEITATRLKPNTSGRVVLDGLTGYINAGGRGTRLNNVVGSHPERGVAKALLRVGSPSLYLINHQINRMDSVGVSVINAGVGDHQEVAEHIKSYYPSQDHIRPIYYEDQLGTAGDLIRAVRDSLQYFDRDILVANVDTLLDLNESQLLDFHRSNGADLSIVLTTKKGVPNQDAFHLDSSDRVVYSAEAPIEEKIKSAPDLTSYRASSAGVLIIRKELLNDMPWRSKDGPISLYRDVMQFALGQSAVFGFNNGEALFIDVGTADTWRYVQERPELIQSHLNYGIQQEGVAA